jgi:hypothetical protein
LQTAENQMQVQLHQTREFGPLPNKLEEQCLTIVVLFEEKFSFLVLELEEDRVRP